MTNLLLDSHALLWALHDPGRLRPAAARLGVAHVVCCIATPRLPGVGGGWRTSPAKPLGWETSPYREHHTVVGGIFLRISQPPAGLIRLLPAVRASLLLAAGAYAVSPSPGGTRVLPDLDQEFGNQRLDVFMVQSHRIAPSANDRYTP